MPIKPLSWRDFTGGLFLKGPRENNPPNSLRRATSVYPLRTGALRSRAGCVQISTLVAHSLYKFAGNRIAGVGAGLWREVTGVFTQLIFGGMSGNRLTFVSGPPTVGVPDYVFITGGTTGGSKLIKLNPALDTVQQWGLDPPTGTKPSVVAQAVPASLLIDAMDATTGWTAGGGASAFGTDAVKFVQGAASLKFTAAKDAESTIDKDITVNLNQFAAPGDSGDEDYIELYLAFQRPKHIKNMEVVFYLGAAPADKNNAANTYSRELNFKLVKKQQKRRLVGTGDLIRKKDVKDFLNSAKLEAANFSTAEFNSADRVGVTRNAWTRLTLAKSSFDANGQAGSAGFTWADVKSIRLSVETTKQGSSIVWIDRIRMIGGVGMSGNYQYLFTFRNDTTKTRSNAFPTKTDSVTGATVFDPVTIDNVDRFGADLGTTQALPAPVDAQVTHIEIWRTVGSGTGFFLADKVASTVGAPATTYQDRVADYPGMFSGGGGTKFLQPEELPDDNDRPDDTIADVVGPFLGRLWMTRSTTTGTISRVWYSPVGRLEAMQNYVDVGSANEVSQKLAVFNETLYCLTKVGLYRLVNSDEPFVFLPVIGAPGTRFPGTVTVTDVGIVYQANDGMRLFDGNVSGLIADDALAPIFRGAASDGLQAFAGVVSAFGRNEYYVSDAVNTTLAYSPDGGWRNVGLPCQAMFYEADSGVLLATARILAPPVSAVVVRSTGNLVINTANPFVSLGSAAAVATDAAARSLAIGKATFTRMFVLLNANLAGGGTVTFNLYVNGVLQAGLAVTIASGAASGNASGSVVVNDGDVVSLGAVFAGGTVTSTVQAITLAYTAGS